MSPERGRSFAVWISRAFHPFLVPLPVLAFSLHAAGTAWAASLGWTLLCVAVVVLPSLALLAIERLRRGDGDWFVTVREQRRGLYALGAACLLLLMGILVLSGAPRLLVASLAGAIAANAIGALLNRVTKVSVHTGAMAGSAVLLGHVAPSGGAALSALTLLVAWARLRLGHHTLQEVALGGIVAPSCVFLALWLVP